MDNPTITIPPLDGESSKAYTSRVQYLTMGPERSLEKLRQSYGKRTASYTRQLEAWSTRFHWQEHARRWDEQNASLIARAASEQYRKDLEDHRARYQQSGQVLYGLAMLLATRIKKQLDDGTLRLSGANLATIAQALTVAADLEAHALQIGELLPRLGDGES